MNDGTIPKIPSKIMNELFALQAIIYAQDISKIRSIDIENADKYLKLLRQRKQIVDKLQYQ